MKNEPQGSFFTRSKLLVFVFLVFAGLVCDTAAGLASGLAGSLAFAAAAVLCAFAKVAGFKSDNSFHDFFLRVVEMIFHL